MSEIHTAYLGTGASSSSDRDIARLARVFKAG